MAHPERYRWLDPLLVDLVDAIFDALGYRGQGSLPGLVALVRPDAPAPLGELHKKRLQRARQVGGAGMRGEVERVLRELGCPAASEASVVGQALLAGADGHRLAPSFAEWAEAALDAAWGAFRRPPHDRTRSGFVTRALGASRPGFDATLDAGSTVASLATLMGVLRDPLDHGPGVECQVGCLAWLPQVGDATGALVPSRHQLLHRAYTERASALGAPDPGTPVSQACVIAEVIGQDEETVLRGRTRLCGPSRLRAGTAAMAGPISAGLLAVHLGLEAPAPIRHLWAGTLTLVDRLQRRLLAEGCTPDKIESAFGRYPCQRLLHSFDNEPDWPYRLVSQIQSNAISVRKATRAIANRHRRIVARESGAR